MYESGANLGPSPRPGKAVPIIGTRYLRRYTRRLGPDNHADNIERRDDQIQHDVRAGREPVLYMRGEVSRQP